MTGGGLRKRPQLSEAVDHDTRRTRALRRAHSRDVREPRLAPPVAPAPSRSRFSPPLLAFLIGGLVVLVLSGKNPLSTYRAIFNGTGLNWLLPWETCSYPCVAASNLQQTLIQFTVLVLTGLAVAFAFRCGLFNIGGQGQYIVGTVTAVWIGTFRLAPTFLRVDLPAWLSSHRLASGGLAVTVAIVAAAIAGGSWAGIAGFLKATVGAHEVITTIMLNWIAIWVASYLVGIGGPIQDAGAAAQVGVS